MSKSVYNFPIVKETQTTALTNIDNLLNVSISGPLNNQGLVFNNAVSKWQNKNIVNSFNSRFGDVLPIEGDYSLNMLSDVVITSPLNGQVLKYNTGAGRWEPANENTGLTSVGLALPNIFTVAGSPLISNGTITATFNAQNQNLFFASPNGLAGIPSFRAINLSDLPTISITDINGASVLANSTNINLTTLNNFDFLTYDLSSAKWKNSVINTYKNYQLATIGALYNVSANTFYLCEGNNAFTMYYTYNLNEKVFIHCGDSGTQITVIFPAGGRINGISGPITLNSSSGYIEFVSVGQLAWEMTDCRPTWFYSGTPLIKNAINTSYILDFNISSPTNGQFLTYNSGLSKWQNQTYTPPVLSVFGRTGTVVATSGDYSISQITNASILADSTNINISAPSNGDILSYNTLSSKWINIKNKDYFLFNSDGNLANNNYLYAGYGQNASESRAQVLLHNNINITSISVFLFTASGLGNSRTFTIRLNGANTAGVLTIADNATTATLNLNINATAGQRFSLLHTSAGASASIGLLNIVYDYI